jgi:hypothetical protein
LGGEKQMGSRRDFRGFSRRAALLAASLAIVLGLSITAYATNLFGFGDVAGMIDPTVAESFDGDSAVEINESQISGDYSVTLLGMAQGGKISPLGSEVTEDDHTYLAVAVKKTDGSAISKDSAFHILPLISGEKPWQVSFGEYAQSWTVKDGVFYTLVDVEDLSVFADRTVYLAVMDTPFYDHDKFVYDEQSGEISINSEYAGVVTLFELPLDKSKADPEAAAKILAGETDETAEGTQAEEDAAAITQAIDDQLDLLPGEDFVLIEESVKEVTINADGSWEYNGYQAMADGREGHDSGVLGQLKWNKNGYAVINFMTMEKDGETTHTECTMLKKEADGKIYGMIYECPNFEFEAVAK